MLEINSSSNKLIKTFISLKTSKGRKENKLFILDDIDLINEANNLGLLKYYLFDKENNNKFNCELIKTNNTILSKLSNLETIPNGIGIASLREFNNKFSNKIIALDDVQDPGNGGTILRSALAFNFDTMILSNNSFDIYNEKFIRASKGSFFNENIVKGDLISILNDLKIQGYEIVIADLDKTSININDYKLDNKMVLVVGNEGNGISKEIKNIATKTVFIPMNSKIESLNVGVAASIIMSKNIL